MFGFSGKKQQPSNTRVVDDPDSRFRFSNIILAKVKGKNAEAEFIRKPLTGNVQEDAKRMKEIINIVGNNVEEDLRRYLFNVLPDDDENGFFSRHSDVKTKQMLSNIIFDGSEINVSFQFTQELDPNIMQYFYRSLKQNALAELNGNVNLYINKNAPGYEGKNVIFLMEWMLRQEGNDDRTALQKIVRYYLHIYAIKMENYAKQRGFEQQIEAETVLCMKELMPKMEEMRKKCQPDGRHYALGWYNNGWNGIIAPQRPRFPQQWRGLYDELKPLERKDYIGSISMNYEGQEGAKTKSVAIEKEDKPNSEIGSKLDRFADKFGSKSEDT